MNVSSGRTSWPALIVWNLQLLGVYRRQEIKCKTNCDSCLRKVEMEGENCRDETAFRRGSHWNQSSSQRERPTDLPVMDYPVPLAKEDCDFCHDENDDDGLKEVLLPMNTFYDKGLLGSLTSQNSGLSWHKEAANRLGSCFSEHVREQERDGQDDNDMWITMPLRDLGPGIMARDLLRDRENDLTRRSEVIRPSSRSSCDPGRDHTDTIRHGTEFESECAICQSLTWNGDATPVNQESILDPGLSLRAKGFLLSSVVMAILMVVSTFREVRILYLMFGKTNMILHLTSLCSTEFVLGSPVAICFCSIVFSYVKGGRYPSDVLAIRSHVQLWYIILHQDYVTRRLQFLSSATVNTRRIPQLWIAVVIVWTFINSVVLRLVLDGFSYYAGWDLLIGLTSAALFYVFGVFTMFLSLIRRSFEQELETVLLFVLRYDDRLDWCRSRVSETYRDFRVLNRALNTWMLFSVNLGLLGLTAHLNWNYMVLSQSLSNNQDRNVIILDLLIFSEKCQILFLPLIGLHSFADLNYIWAEFRHALSRHRRQDNEFFWDGILRHVDTLRYEDFRKSVDLKSLLTLSSLYLGLQLGWQNWNYHSVVDTNYTNLTPTSAPTT